MTDADRCTDSNCKHALESDCHDTRRLHYPFCRSGVHPFRRKRVPADDDISLPVYFDWVGTTGRVFNADGSSSIVVASRAVGEQVVAALNAFEIKDD
jgi:hypothetical protein